MQALSAPPAPTLRTVLADLGISMTRLAHDLGVSHTAVRRWCSGERRPEKAAALAAWLAARGVVLDELFPGLEADVADRVVRLHPRKATPQPSEPSPPEEPMDIATAEFLEQLTAERFALPSDPFDTPENPEDIWMSPALRRIEAILLEAKRKRQIVAIVGEPGSGKSTLLRRVHARQATDRNVRLIVPATLNRAQINANALAVAILRDLTGQDTSSMATEPRSELLRTTLQEMGRSGISPILLVDEAHKLANAGLLAIKQVWDSHTMWRDLTVFLMGQRPLKDRLRTDATIREVAGRTLVVELPALADAGDYLRWRFSRIGVDADDIFTPEAYKLLAGRGEHLLWVNNLAIRAMNYAAAHAEPRVTAACVGRV